MDKKNSEARELEAALQELSNEISAHPTKEAAWRAGYIDGVKASSGDVERLTAENERLRDEVRSQMRRAERAEHVVIECGVSHEVLNACGCHECELARIGLVKAGYLRPLPEEG